MWISAVVDRKSEILSGKIKRKPGKAKQNIRTDKYKSKGCVVIPYVKGLIKSVARVMRKNITYRYLCNHIPKTK